MENIITTNAGKQILISSAKAAYQRALVLGHSLIGGLRSVVNGGKFLTGALTAGIGKVFTFGTNMLAGEGFGRTLVQGLAVATVGGLTAILAGGSFELGFITAGLAFAQGTIQVLATVLGLTACTTRGRAACMRPNRVCGRLKHIISIYRAIW